MLTEFNKPHMLTEFNKPHMRLWVAALRSADWGQATDQLASKQIGEHQWRFCCLGVACEIAINDGVGLKVTTESNKHLLFRSYQSAAFGDKTSALLPRAVRLWLGLPDETDDPLLQITPDARDWMRQRAAQDDVDHDPESEALHAAELNDEFGMPFELIADCIEYTFLREDWDARSREEQSR